jgi:hypothetical protein
MGVSMPIPWKFVTCSEICGKNSPITARNGDVSFEHVSLPFNSSDYSLSFIVIGKTGTMLSTDVENTNSAAWISYWRSLEDLQAFAQAEAHQKGFQWYMKGKHPSIGIMHETYVVPAGNWETIYHNFVPFGLGELSTV